MRCGYGSSRSWRESKGKKDELATARFHCISGQRSCSPEPTIMDHDRGLFFNYWTQHATSFLDRESSCNFQDSGLAPQNRSLATPGIITSGSRKYPCAAGEQGDRSRPPLAGRSWSAFRYNRTHDWTSSGPGSGRVACSRTRSPSPRHRALNAAPASGGTLGLCRLRIVPRDSESSSGGVQTLGTVLFFERCLNHHCPSPRTMGRVRISLWNQGKIHSSYSQNSFYCRHIRCYSHPRSLELSCSKCNCPPNYPRRLRHPVRSRTRRRIVPMPGIHSSGWGVCFFLSPRHHLRIGCRAICCFKAACTSRKVRNEEARSQK